MNKYRLLGVYREKRFSPGMVEKDAAVLKSVLNRLAGEKYPFEIESVSGEELSKVKRRPDFVLTMAQSEESLDKLSSWTSSVEIINRVEGVRNCYREKMIRLLADANVGFPETFLLSVNEIERESTLPFPVWLKRSDVHAMFEGDVVFVDSAKSLERALHGFRERGIEKLTIQHHVPGPVWKFYGVGKGDFFKVFRGKGQPETDDRMVTGLKKLAIRAAEALRLEVYGGDAVLDDQRGIHIIDMNDWPSFSACCDQAAEAISGYVIRKWKIN